MFKSYDKFTNNFKKVIQRAAWLCLNDLQKIITPTQLFWGIISVPESIAYEILKKAGVIVKIKQQSTNISKLTKFNSINPKLHYNEVFSLSMNRESIDILEKAADLAASDQAAFIGTEHLLAAMIELETPILKEKIKEADIDFSAFKEDVKTILRTKADTFKLGRLKNLAPNANKSAQPFHLATMAQKHQSAKQTNKRKLRHSFIKPTPALDHFTIDLTSKNNQKNLHPIVGREKEIDRLINILSRKRKNNPLLLGEPGVGKTAIVEGLAKKIFDNHVPDILINKKILSLDLNAIVAGTIYRGEFENRLKQITEEIQAQDDVILFIDEIHNIIGAGSASGSLDAANILKPYLARGELACIGATTFQEYKSHIENDTALERRFQTIIVEEPTKEETTTILLGIKNNWEDYHRVTIADEAITEAVNLSARFLPNKYFPDKAIDLIDEAASRAKVKNIKDIYNKQIRVVQEELKELIQSKEQAVLDENFSDALATKSKEDQLLTTLLDLKKKQKQASKKRVAKISKKHIAEVVTDIIKIPFLEMIQQDQKKKLLNLEHILGQRVRGQTTVLKEIAKTLRRAEAGLADPKRPLASFIYLGPSGVGKTETAKVIAEEVFGDKNNLIRINMSEFQESFNTSKLIGAPAGYIGYKDSNQLADKVRSKPYSVVLFDEMEKAHPDVFNILLQVLEDGYLLDASGKHINFKNSVIIFTSNIGLERFNQAQNLGFASQDKNPKDKLQRQFANIKANILKELYSNFRVEFLNRIDKILFFEPLTPKTLAEIVTLNIEELNQRLSEQKISVSISKEAKNYLAKISFSPDDGARSVRRIIQEQVEETLVEKILKGEAKSGDKLKIDLKGDKITIT